MKKLQENVLQSRYLNRHACVLKTTTALTAKFLIVFLAKSYHPPEDNTYQIAPFMIVSIICRNMMGILPVISFHPRIKYSFSWEWTVPMKTLLVWKKRWIYHLNINSDLILNRWHTKMMVPVRILVFQKFLKNQSNLQRTKQLTQPLTGCLNLTSCWMKREILLNLNISGNLRI